MSEHVVGVDGCRGGWLVCRFNLAAETIDLLTVTTSFAQILEREKIACCIAVDIPIGLPEPGSARRCDVEARRILTRMRASSVFPAPLSIVSGRARSLLCLSEIKTDLRE